MKRDFSWEAAEGALENAVTLAYPKAGWKTLMLPNASDLYRGRFLTHVPLLDSVSSKAEPDTFHEPLLIAFSAVSVRVRSSSGLRWISVPLA